MSRNILIASDLSLQSENVVRRGLLLARTANASCTVLHRPVPSCMFSIRSGLVNRPNGGACAIGLCNTEVRIVAHACTDIARPQPDYGGAPEPAIREHAHRRYQEARAGRARLRIRPART